MYLYSVFCVLLIFCIYTVFSVFCRYCVFQWTIRGLPLPRKLCVYCKFRVYLFHCYWTLPRKLCVYCRCRVYLTLPRKLCVYCKCRVYLTLPRKLCVYCKCRVYLTYCYLTLYWDLNIVDFKQLTVHGTCISSILILNSLNIYVEMIWKLNVFYPQYMFLKASDSTTFLLMHLSRFYCILTVFAIDMENFLYSWTLIKIVHCFFLYWLVWTEWSSCNDFLQHWVMNIAGSCSRSYNSLDLILLKLLHYNAWITLIAELSKNNYFLQESFYGKKSLLERENAVWF